MAVVQRTPNLAEAYYNLGVLYLENEVPGYEPEDRYGLAVKNFSTYRDLLGASLAADDPAFKYIKEAQTLQAQSVELKEQLRLMKEQDQPVEGEGTPAPDGEAVAPVDGEAVAPVEGEAVAPVDGEAVAPVEGEAVAPVDGEAVPSEGVVPEPATF
jgi:hypothetical protein